MRSVQGGPLRLDLRLVDVRFDLQQQFAFVNDLSFLHRNLDDLARDFRRDLHLDLRLDLSRRGHELGDRLPKRFVGSDRDRLLALASSHHRDERDHDQRRCANQENEFLFLRHFHGSHYPLSTFSGRQGCNAELVQTQFA